MPKMSDAELRALLAAEKADALSAMAASKLSEERAAALDYYLGDMSRDMPAPDGRSKAVSTDVADTVEGLMPALMDIFTSGDEVVRFEPVGPEDVAAAEQETDYVNHVFMQQNAGFIVLYSFIKDALLSKVGIVKVWWETREEHERETYYDLDDAAFAIISAEPGVESVAHTERRPANSEIAGSEEAHPDSPPAISHSLLHDVTVRTTRTRQCARVEGVPPEEFGIARNARSIRDTDYCFHDVLRSEARLIAQGYDREQIKRLPSHGVADTIEAQARDTVNEGTQKQGDEGHNTASRLIHVTEHYVRMDYEGNDLLSEDGRKRPDARLYRVTTGGEGEVLKRDGEPDVIEVDEIPFAAMTPVIVTHRFFGRSIADLVMDIQRIKTSLLRALLDNAYLANNPRTEVPESHATETTLDDLLVSRPGGIVRTKLPGGLSVIAHPDVGGHAFPLLQYQDATREWRTGVSRQPGRRPQCPAEPGRDHCQPDVQRGAGEDEDDRAHLRRDRHPRPVRAAARGGPQARLAAADGAAAQPVDHGRPARLEGAQRHDHQCRPRHRHQDRAVRASQHGHRRPGEGHRRRAGEPEEPLQFGPGAHQARGPQERWPVLHAARHARRSERPGVGPDPASVGSEGAGSATAHRARDSQGRSRWAAQRAEATGRPADERGQDRGRYAIQARAAQDRVRSQGAADER